jgi:hypothetical protein
MKHRYLQSRLGIGAGNNGPAAGWNDHNRFLAEGFEKKPHSKSSAAAGAADMA